MRRFEIHIDGKKFFEGVQYPDGDFAGRIWHSRQEGPIWASGHDLNRIAGNIEHTVTMIDDHNQPKFRPGFEPSMYGEGG